MVDRSMTGVYPILQTPFDAEGRIDEEDLRREVEWAIDCGVDGLGIALASEVHKLNEAERDLVLRTVVDQANGRAKVIMNTGAESTDVTALYSTRAEELGADGVMIAPPKFMPVHPSEVVLHFKTVAEAIHIPVFMQDQPAAPIGPGLAANIARQHENLCYAKIETPPTVPRVAELASLRGDTGLIIFGGYGGMFLFEEIRRGSVGTMPGCTIPDVFVRLWRMWHEGDRQKAESEFRRYAAYTRVVIQASGLSAWIYKHVLVRRGIFKTAHTRRPALPPDERQFREVDEILDELCLSGT